MPRWVSIFDFHVSRKITALLAIVVLISPMIPVAHSTNEDYQLLKVISNTQWPQSVEGIATDSIGRLYVPDAGNHRVLRVTLNGDIDWTFGNLTTNMNLPLGIAIDSPDNFYVTDDGSKCINKYDPAGEPIGSPWCNYGKNNDLKIARPVSIAVSADGFVYVVDGDGNKIIKYTSAGKYVLDWGGFGSQNSQFDHPWGVAVGTSGDVYVTDSANSRIQKFRSDGTFITSWGMGGSAPGQLAGPLGISVIATNTGEYVFVTEYGNHRVQKFDTDGTYITGWGTFCALTDRLYQIGSGCVDPDGAGPLKTGDGQFQHPYAVVADKSGLVYVADTYNNRIEVFSSNSFPVPTFDVEPQLKNVLDILGCRPGVDSYPCEPHVEAFGIGGSKSFGQPVTDRMPGPPASGVLYHQLFRYVDPTTHATNPYLNSVDKVIRDGRTCYEIAFTDPTSPSWYDNWSVAETTKRLAGMISRQDAFRQWANDPRLFGYFTEGHPEGNWVPEFWENLDSAHLIRGNGPAFPPGRGPAPHWFEVCLDANNKPIIDPTLLWTDKINHDPGHCINTLFDAPEWVPLQPDSLTPTTISWEQHYATGTVTNTWRSGADFGNRHFPPIGWGNGQLGTLYEGNFYYSPPINPNECNGFEEANAFCNDWETILWPDPPSNKFATEGNPESGFRPDLVRNLGTEIEQWQVPLGYRPDPGDRATLVGRSIQDCAHADNHTELHPLEALESSFLQTGPLLRGEPFVPWVPASDVSTDFTTTNIPSLVAFNNRLYMAWKDQANGIWLSSFDETSWAPEQHIPGISTNDSPSLAAYNGRLYLAWKAEDGAIHFSYSSDGSTWFPEQPATISGVGEGPSIAAFDGHLYMAWKDEDTGIHVSSCSGQCTTGVQSPASDWTPGLHVRDGANGVPALAAFGGKLYLAWKEINQGAIHFSFSTDGINWSPETPATFGGVGIGPSLTTYGGLLYMVWKDEGIGTHISRCFDPCSGMSSWTPEQQTGVLTEPGLSLGVYNDRLYMAFKGSQHFDRQIYVASSDMHGLNMHGIGNASSPSVFEAGNVPSISDHWRDYTQGKNAVITKLVLTQDWQGEPLEFDIRPPSKPDVSSKLHYQTEAVVASSGVKIITSPVPPENPDHLHATVFHDPSVPLVPLTYNIDSTIGSGDTIAIHPGPDRQLVYSFMLWWEMPKPIKVETKLLNDATGLEVNSTAAIPAGQSLHDIAEFNATNVHGHLEYLRYSSPDCSGASVEVSAADLTNGAAPPSASHNYSGSGIFSWRALYSRDTQYLNTYSQCEPVRVVGIQVTKQFSNSFLASNTLSKDAGGNYLARVVLTHSTKDFVASSNPKQVSQQFLVTSDEQNVPLKSIKGMDILPINWKLNPDSARAVTIFFQPKNSSILRDISNSAVVSITDGTNPFADQPGGGTRTVVAFQIGDISVATVAGRALEPGDKILVVVKMQYGLSGYTVDPTKYPFAALSAVQVSASSGPSFAGINQSAAGSAILKLYK